MEKRAFSVIVLAGGKGTRMKSPLPKVVHPVAGKPMISRVIETVQRAGATEVRVVVGFGENIVKQVVEPLGVFCHKQKDQLGTADAVKSAEPESLDGTVVIMNGDHPLIKSSDIEDFVREFEEENYDLAVVSAELKNPGSFGRIVRNGGYLKAIVEAVDASASTLTINEVNTGVYIVSARVLNEYLPLIQDNNAKNEYYLTDIIALAGDAGKTLGAIKAHPRVAFGVNSQVELAKATRVAFRQKAKSLLDEGVMLIDPAKTYVEEDVEVGAATVLFPNVYLRGKTKLGSLCVVEPNSYILNCEIGQSVQIKAGSYFEDSVVKDQASCGPYARLRPQSEVGEEAHIGNFVEMKKAKLGPKSKAGHLTYLGDAEIGAETNIGCGTITCNYAADRKKYKTKIGSHVFVGSDSQFVAPVEVGDGAIIGSGSTITKDVPSEALSVARGKQFIKEGYASKYKKK